MNQPRKPKKVKAPEGLTADYITSGKEYSVVEVVDFTKRLGTGFYIEDDNGELRYSIEKESCHLNDGDWIVTEWEDENN